MIVVIDGKVQNSENSVVSVLLFADEREEMVKALTSNKDIFNSYPSDTPDADVKKNENVLRNAKQARDAKAALEIKEL